MTDEAVEQRIREWRDQLFAAVTRAEGSMPFRPLDEIETALRTAWAEATEAAAKKCEEAGRAWENWPASSLNDQRKKNARRDEAFCLAAAIRKQP